VSAPHADRDGSERWELEDGDMGEPIRPVVVRPNDGHTHVWVYRQPITASGYTAPPYEACICGASRSATSGPGPTTGLPEYIAGLKEQIVQLQLDLATAHTDHAQTLLKAAADERHFEWQAAYWEWGARFGRRKRIWRSGWDHWGLKWFAGGDEYGRHTIVVGPWVIALWSCRCADCKAEETHLLSIIDADIDADPATPEEES
jgi:hypothetical protein